MPYRLQLLLLLMALPLLAEKLPWQTDHDAALAQAAAEERQLLISVKADWCRYCRLMEETTLADPTLRRLLQDRVRLIIDFERQPELVARYQVHALPTFLLLEPDGTLSSRLTGFHKTDAFRRWLEQPPPAMPQALPAANDAWEGWNQQQRLARIPTIFEQVIADKDRRQTEEQEAFLRTVAKAQPSHFLPYLQDPRLAARIFAWNLLIQHDASTAIAYDPWAEAPAREAASQLLRDHLQEAQP